MDFRDLANILTPEQRFDAIVAIMRGMVWRRIEITNMMNLTPIGFRMPKPIAALVHPPGDDEAVGS